MRHDTLNIDTGLVELEVNGVRTITFNPSDQGWVEDLYCLVGQLEDIQKKYATMTEEEMDSDPAKIFEAGRAREKEMRAAVDALFGDGFCSDVFAVRLAALSGGLSIIEGFLYALLDKVDKDLMDNLAARDERIRKYTEKYSKYRKGYHR